MTLPIDTSVYGQLELTIIGLLLVDPRATKFITKNKSEHYGYDICLGVAPRQLNFSKGLKYLW